MEEAVRSIMNQTLRDIEIIIIDDGSTDHSWSLIQKLACEDKRIKLYKQSNQGLSNTRNYGIRIASGTYLYFMDSDDILVSEALESCFQVCMEKNLDFVFFDAKSFDQNSDVSVGFDYQRTYLFDESIIYTGKEMLDKMLDENKYRASACLNLIKRKFIEQFQLDFYPNIIHEDELFTAQLFLLSSRVSCVQKTFYHRRIREDSIMFKKFNARDVEGYLIVVGVLGQISQKEVKLKAAIEKLMRYILNPAIYNSKDLSAINRIQLLLHCIKNKYIFLITTKNVFILLFPFLVKVKAIFKNFFPCRL